MQNDDYPRLARDAAQAGKYSQAESLFSKAVEQARRDNKLNASADLLTELGDVYARDRKLNEAADVYRKALTLIESVKGTDSADRSALLTHDLLITAKLAITLGDLNQLEQASALYEKILHANPLALTVSERSKIAMDYVQLLRKEHKDSQADELQTVTEATMSYQSLGALGNSDFDKGKFDQAETLFKAVFRGANGNYVDQSDASSMLGICALRFGHIDEAESRNRESLALCGNIDDPVKRSQQKARALAVLSFCASAKQRPQEAEKLLKESAGADAYAASVALIRTLGLLTKTNQVEMAKSMMSLCLQLLPYLHSSNEKLGLLRHLEAAARKTDSSQLVNDVRNKMSLMGGSMNIEMLISQAHDYRDEKKYSQAIPLFAKAIAYFDKSKSERLARSATLELCACLYLEGRIKEARLRLGELLSRIEKNPQPGFLDEALMDAGAWDRQLGNHELSLSEFVRALPLVQKHGNRPLLANLLFFDLADGYRTAGKTADYESSTRRALALYQELGDNVGTSRAMETLAICLEGQGKLAEAQAEWKDLLAFRQSRFGAKSLETTTALFQLGKLERAMKNAK